jgi:hypothetical protein
MSDVEYGDDYGVYDAFEESDLPSYASSDSFRSSSSSSSGSDSSSRGDGSDGGESAPSDCDSWSSSLSSEFCQDGVEDMDWERTEWSAAQFLNDAVVEPLLDRVHSWLGSFGQKLVSRLNTHTAQPPDTAAPAATKRKRQSRDGTKSGVYVLKLEKNRWYVGCSLDVDKRIRQHRAGLCVPCFLPRTSSRAHSSPHPVVLHGQANSSGSRRKAPARCLLTSYKRRNWVRSGAAHTSLLVSKHSERSSAGQIRRCN